MSDPPPPASPSDPPLPAKVGRYEVVRLLGEGAMGRVLLAHDPVLDREVAVKHLRGDLKIPREVRHGLLARMRHEARAAARLAHPNLVVLHDMGEDPAVGLYLVFEYVEGPTLKQRLRDEGRLPPAETARLARDLGSALTVAHEAGILHRDVKPENIILARMGGKLADFGIARIPDSTLTHQGGLMGTPAYSAPETFRGGKFSPASDQFSLAASLYEALSGLRAFPGDDAVTVAARISQDPPDPIAAAAGLPSAVDAVLARALGRLPDARFPSCDDFGAALSRSLSPELAEPAASPPLPSPVPSPVEPTLVSAPPPERRTGQVAVGALLVVATAALVVRTAIRSAEPSPEPAASALESPAPTASSHAARPHLPSPLPSLPRPARPRTDPRSEPSAAPAASAAPARSGEPGVPAAADAGAVAPLVTPGVTPPVAPATPSTAPSAGPVGSASARP